MRQPILDLSFTRDEAEGLADLLAGQFRDKGFIALSEEIYTWIESLDKEK